MSRKPPLPDSGRRPLLMCDRCRCLRLHRIKELIEECFQWREIWSCIVCGHERGWGASDPLKIYRAPHVPAFDQRFVD